MLLFLLSHYLYMYYIYVQGAAWAAWKAAGRGLAYAQNVSDDVVKDGGNTLCLRVYMYVFLFSQPSKIRCVGEGYN